MFKLSGERGGDEGDEETVHQHQLTAGERKGDTSGCDGESDAGKSKSKIAVSKSVTSEILKAVTRVLVAPVTRASLTREEREQSEEEEEEEEEGEEGESESEELLAQDQVTIETNVSPIELMWQESTSSSSCRRRRVKRREEKCGGERKQEINEAREEEEKDEQDEEENQVKIEVTKFKATEGESAHETDEKASDLKVVCRDKEEPLHPEETMGKQSCMRRKQKGANWSRGGGESERTTRRLERKRERGMRQIM